MSLKILINNKKIESYRHELSELEKREEKLKLKEVELETAINEAKTDEEIDTVSEELEQHSKDLDSLEKEKKNLNEKIEEIEKETEELRNKKPKMEAKEMDNDTRNNKEISNEVVAYIRSKGVKQVRDQIKSNEVGVLIPKDISYNPTDEVSTIFDLSTLVSKTAVSTASGKYPVLKRAKATLNSVSELEKSPELAKPDFREVSWEVETYRGAIPLSEEAISDSQVDVLSIVQKNANEQKINTVNQKISDVLKSFPAKSANSLDDIKKILNVDLDQGYSRQFVVSQTFFQEMDVLKDKNGKYILNENVAVGTGRTLLGYPLIVVNDELLGNKGEAKAFIGDLKQGILYADRAEFGVRWIDNLIYGQYLQIGLRFGVVKITEEAGYFVTYTSPTV